MFLRVICEWAGVANDWQSTTRYIIFLDVGIILWKCKKQPIIKEVLWLWQILADVGYVQRNLHPSCVIIKDA